MIEDHRNPETLPKVSIVVGNMKGIRKTVNFTSN